MSDSSSSNNMSSLYYCSYVGADYIICECGDNFANEDLLKEHLKNNHSSTSEVLLKEEVVEEEIQDDVEVETQYFDYQEPVETKVEETYEVPVVLPSKLTYSIKTRIKDEQIEFLVEESEQIVDSVSELQQESEPQILAEEDFNNVILQEEVYEEDPELALATESLVKNHLSDQNSQETFMSTEELLRSHLTENNMIAPDQKLRFCDPCRKIFTNENAYVVHCRRVHMRVIRKPPSKLKGIPKPRNTLIVQRPTKAKYKNKMCEVCGKSFASNAALTYHQRIHTGEKPYLCEVCQKGFAMPLLLQIHSRTHTGERPYQCHLCPKAFSNKAAINRHMRVHTGVKPYPCPECGKTFTQSNSMKLHVRTVHLKLPAPYKSKQRRERAAERLRLARQAARGAPLHPDDSD